MGKIKYREGLAATPVKKKEKKAIEEPKLSKKQLAHLKRMEEAEK